MKKETNQREVTQKLCKGEQPFSVTYRLNLIYIAKKFHHDIPYGYLLMVRTRPLKKKI